MIDFNSVLSLYPENLRGFKRNIYREYLQYKMLSIIFNSPFGNKLSFLGGTALRIVHNNTRFSEDLDFDNFLLTENDFEEITNIIKDSMESEGYKVELKNVYKSAYRCYFRLPDILYKQGLSPFKEEKVLIQIDSAAHHYDYNPNKYILNKFEVFCPIRTTPIDILLSQKIFAVFNRKTAKGRDFFDIVFLLSRTKPNYRYLNQKLGIENSTELKNELLIRIRNLDFNNLANDVKPFLFNPNDSQRVKLFKEYIKDISLE